MASIGVIYGERSVGARIEKLLKTAGRKVVFSVPIHGSDAGSGVVDLVVLATTSWTLDLWKRSRELHPQARFVVCVAENQVATVQKSVESGIDGVVLENRLQESMGPTVEAVLARQLVFPREFRERARSPVFTNREKQVLGLMIMGLTNHEIASKLFVSENTVKSHLNTAFRKLGVHSRAAATRMIADPEVGLGTGILAITESGLRRSRGR